MGDVMLRKLPRRRRLGVALGLVCAPFVLGALDIGASTPPSHAVSVPDKAGETVTISWHGEIPVAQANPTSNCIEAPIVTDDHLVNLVGPDRGYEKVDATFTFEITWKPTSPGVVSDEILTVTRHKGTDEGDTESEEVGSSDGGVPKETVVAHNLASGEYHVLACGFANALPQPYDGTLTVTTTARNAESSLRSANAHGLAFSAAVPADPQRDEAEPLIEIDRDGNIYTCGPTGFSNASDYAQVSTDGGDQFHILGTPPRGQQSAGGGGDCALATGLARNSQGHYQYAYAGLGALTGYATSTSPDNGHSIATAGADANGVITSEGAASDRQWMTFVGAHDVLLTWNQQVPRNTVVQPSADDGLTYSAFTSIAAPNPEFPGPIRYIPSLGIVYLPWTKGEQVNLAVSRDRGRTFTDCKVASGDVVKGGTSGFAVADHDAAGNVYVVWSDSSRYHTWVSMLTADRLAACNQAVDEVRDTDDGEPTVAPGWSTPVQVDRDDVRTTVFPWVAAGGAPGRLAVAFYGTTSDGDPNTGAFDAAWDVYVNQSFDGGRDFSQVKATTHPFHYDSICLNGLGCDLSAPPGDRTLADFFAIGYSPATGKLSVVFDRTNKKPDEPLGHIATPMVVTQSGGPSNGGGDVPAGRAAARSAADDPSGDALSSYSVAAPAATPPPPPTKNEPAADFTSATVGADAASGGFTVTLKVRDLSAAALGRALADTGGQSLLWIWRFGNGYSDSAASASWSPSTGFTFGFDDYETGAAPCSTPPGSGEKCQLYTQATPIVGKVDALAGTITLVVPKGYLRQLAGADAAGRPLETAAGAGARFYDGTAFSFANNVGPSQATQSFLYTLDNTPAMDFLLPSGGKPGGAGGGGGGAAPAQPTATSSPAPAGGVAGATKTVVRHLVRAQAAVRARARTGVATLVVDLRHGPATKVVYRDVQAKLRFHSLRVASIQVQDHTATLRGVGVQNGKRVSFRVVLVDAARDSVRVQLGGYARTATVVKGFVTVR
jgi:hypothetical protein